MIHKHKYFIDDLEQNYLEVEIEAIKDTSDWPFVDVVELLSVSLNGCMSIRLTELPKEWEEGIKEQIL